MIIEFALTVHSERVVGRHQTSIEGSRRIQKGNENDNDN